MMLAFVGRSLRATASSMPSRPYRRHRSVQTARRWHHTLPSRSFRGQVCRRHRSAIHLRAPQRITLDSTRAHRHRCRVQARLVAPRLSVFR